MIKHLVVGNRTRGHNLLTPRITLHFGTNGEPGDVQLRANRPADQRPPVARADALNVPIMAAKVRDSNLANGDYAIVSGLTYCVGVIVATQVGNTFIHAVVAHFNGGYDHLGSWNQIGGAAAVGGTRWGIIIMTSDSTQYDRNMVTSDMQPQLSALGVAERHLFLYHGSHSGVAFGVHSNGDIGEMAGFPF